MNNIDGQIHVLVVDDDESVRYVFGHYLDILGYRVSVAENATEAIQVFDSIQPNLVVTDFRMPGMNGVDLIHALRKDHPDLPIILISGNPSEFQELPAGIKFLPKPVLMDVLTDTISSMCAS